VAGDRHEAYLADKGFTGVQWERRWLEEYGALVAATPYEDSRRAWPKADRRWASFARACYELGQKSHRNADFTVSLVPSRSLFPAFLCRF
jgi:hypothetical protein